MQLYQIVHPFYLPWLSGEQVYRRLRLVTRHQGRGGDLHVPAPVLLGALRVGRGDQVDQLGVGTDRLAEPLGRVDRVEQPGDRHRQVRADDFAQDSRLDGDRAVARALDYEIMELLGEHGPGHQVRRLLAGFAFDHVPQFLDAPAEIL